ncbi:MAG: CPBP family intramembrane metalloprotease [Phycisphaerales bacterium]|nr:MAG: CPBP family intramembrane metalloprotease [Phycisphaerales bacterium]
MAKRATLPRAEAKMLHLPDQVSTLESMPSLESAQQFRSCPRRFHIPLLCETVIVTIGTILAIRVLATSPIAHTTWFVAPGVLVAAALIPTLIRKDEFASIGWTTEQIVPAFSILGRTCLVVFPTVFLGMWILKSNELQLPLRPALPQEQGWIAWLLYQFMYIAVAEEVFFRGYLQNNILKLTDALKRRQRRLQGSIAILLSAACFAIAHVVVQGQMVSAVTFLPGLILAWLFIRTKSLLAPILFHGLANTTYCVMARLFA